MSSPDPRPFDAVLIVAFGGPHGPADVRPFLANVLRGRRVPPERVEEVAHHYELFGGVSPITEITLRQAEGLRERLRESGLDLPVYVGMRNWRPLLNDTLAEMSRAGVRRAIAFIAAAHHSYSSCEQYKENVRDARRALLEAGLPDIEITYVPSWYDRPGFIAAVTDRVREALSRMPVAGSLACASGSDAAPLAGASGSERAVRLIFTAHSIPVEMARKCRYTEQLMTTARQVVEALRTPDWTLVYQSRSGRPQDPWLGPDIGAYLRDQQGKGMQAAVIAPIGFLCDHVEVLYDLDHEAAGLCRELGISMVRAGTVGDHPAFLDVIAEVVRETAERYRRFPPLPIVR